MELDVFAEPLLGARRFSVEGLGLGFRVRGLGFRALRPALNPTCLVLVRSGVEAFGIVGLNKI